MAPRLTVKKDAQSAYIPDASIGKKYIGRKINGHQDFALLDYALENRRNILLMGDTGAGKTLVGEAYAAKRGYYYYSLPCDVSVDPTALFGKITPTKQAGVFEWVDGPVTSIVRHGGVLNISEINFMSPRIAASLYPLLDDRRYIPLLGKDGEVVRAHEKLLIISDMNPNYRGTVELNAAFMNRFDLKIKWGYDSDVEEKLIVSRTLRMIAIDLRMKFGTELDTPVSTNMLMDFEQFSADLGIEFALDNFLATFKENERHAVDNVFNIQLDRLKRELIKEQLLDEAEFEDVEEDDEFVYVQT